MNLLYILFLILPFFVFLSVITDVYNYSIPNYFSVIIIIGFYLFAFLNPKFDWALIGYHTLALFTVFFICFILFIFNILGGGDAKILMASSLWIGFSDLLFYITAIMLVGGFLSFFLILWRKTKPLQFYKKIKLLNSLYFGPLEESEFTKQSHAVPYAVAIAIGLVWILPKTFLVTTVIASYREYL